MQNLPSMARGVKPGINRNDVYALIAILPPLDEQKRIVAVLDAAFEGLTRARAHAEANLENARELFESYSNDVFTQTAKTPATVSLGEVIDVLSGFAFKSGGYIDDET
jgi:type I restriction enzyme S subunit